VTATRGYRTILSALLPAGALGMSILLGSAGAPARETPASGADDVAPPARVAERLAAIRDAMSGIGGLATTPPPAAGERVAWANWPNFSYGIPLPLLPFWNNWHNGWNNWGNHWHNAWNNWPNGWHNAWHNF